MSQVNIVSTLDGFFKRLYADKVVHLIPDNAKLLNMIEFAQAEKLGDSYRQPVSVKHEHGYTYGGADGEAFTLNASKAGLVKDANVKGYESVLRSQISYGVASRSASSEAAFERGTKHVVANMLRSFAKRLEISMLYGQKEIGLVNAATTSSTSFVVSEASWADGIWNGIEDADIQIYDPTLVTDKTSGGVSITAVDLETRTITVSSALTLAAGDRILFKGAKNKEMKGLHAIMTAYVDGVTDLFGINPADYNVWRATTYDAGGGDLSFQKIQQAIAAACGRGLDEDVVCMVSPKTWAKLCTDQAALRVFDSSYQRMQGENGFENITFHAQNGKVEIISNPYMKRSLAMIFPKDCLMRIGSTDITFKLPGESEDKFFRTLENAAGFELRAYSDQALFCSAPNKLALIHNIVNS